MIVPSLRVGKIEKVRSILDPDIDYARVDANPDPRRIRVVSPDGKPWPKWLVEHSESMGRGLLPSVVGKELSVFDVKIIHPSDAAQLDHGESAKSAVEWYCACVVAIDGNESRRLIVEGVPEPMILEIGGYARRLNTEISRPFSRPSPPQPYDPPDGSDA